MAVVKSSTAYVDGKMKTLQNIFSCKSNKQKKALKLEQRRLVRVKEIKPRQKRIASFLQFVDAKPPLLNERKQ